MPTLDVLLYLGCVALLLLTPTGGFGPPYLRLPSDDLRKVVSAGSDATLPCPVRADPGTLFIEWYKGADVTPISGRRYKILESGTLRIRKSVISDSGIYTCRAVNGFGQIEVRATLLVIDTRDIYNASDKTDDSLINLQLNGSPPTITMATSFNGSVIQRSTGGSVRLKCVASGSPTPKITWLKDGLRLRVVNSTMTKGRWSLILEHLKISNSGNYTCLLKNPLGVASASFLLDVVDGTKPEVTGYHPLNTTVEFGATATFQCRVRSEITPHIKWLKKIEASDMETKQRVIRVQGEYFRFLKSSQVVANPEGSFMNKLLIHDAREKDSGKYICLGANTLGYSFRSAYLIVLPPGPHSGMVDWEKTIILRPGQPDALMIGIPITVGIIVGVIVAMAILCHSRKSKSPLVRSVEQQTSFNTFPDCDDDDPERVFHSELVYQEKSVVSKLHECSLPNQIDCFVLRDHV